MISVIVCSNSRFAFQRLKANVTNTIGVEHEIIHYNTQEKLVGICKAYNDSAAVAKHPHLCFVHDDIIFLTKNWGLRIAGHLNDQETGIIGVMGGRYKSAYGLSWRDGEPGMYRYNIKDGTEGGKHLLYNPGHEEKAEVLCLDGAFLCCRKEVWNKYKFDETRFEGFHFYDSDLCMQVGQHYKNYVIYTVLMEHFSQGKLNASFIDDSLKFEEKWSAYLPFTLEKISKGRKNQLEGYALAEKLMVMKKNGLGRSKRVQLIKKYFLANRSLYHLIRSSYFGILK